MSEVLRGVSLVLPERDFFYRAGLLPGRHVRGIDALHLITAMDAEVDTLLTYDHRLMQSAEALGLPSLSPSLTPAGEPGGTPSAADPSSRACRAGS